MKESKQYHTSACCYIVEVPANHYTAQVPFRFDIVVFGEFAESGSCGLLLSDFSAAEGVFRHVLLDMLL